MVARHALAMNAGRRAADLFSVSFVVRSFFHRKAKIFLMLSIIFGVFNFPTNTL